MLSKNPFIFKYNPEYIKDNQNQFIEGDYIKMTIRISLYSHIGECSDSDNEESEKQYIEEVYFNIPDYFTNEHGELLQKYYDKSNIIVRILKNGLNHGVMKNAILNQVVVTM